jgi:hypothetical protein
MPSVTEIPTGGVGSFPGGGIELSGSEAGGGFGLVGTEEDNGGVDSSNCDDGGRISAVGYWARKGFFLGLVGPSHAVPLEGSCFSDRIRIVPRRADHIALLYVRIDTSRHSRSAANLLLDG